MRCTSPACLSATRQWREPSQPLLNSPPLLSLSLSPLTDSHPLLLPLLFMVSLFLSWSLIPLFLYSAVEEECSKVHPSRLGLSGKVSLSLFLSVFDSVCLSVFWLCHFREGTQLHPALHPPFSCCLFIAEIWARWQQLKMAATATELDQQLIAIFTICGLFLLFRFGYDANFGCCTRSNGWALVMWVCNILKESLRE